MPFMLKVRWNIAPGKAEEFRRNQEALCRAMRDHPGVIAYHATYPDPATSEWVELYATDAAFRAHLDNPAGKAPHAAAVAACDSVEAHCFGDPDAANREILAGLGVTLRDTAPGSFVLNPRADPGSEV